MKFNFAKPILLLTIAFSIVLNFLLFQSSTPYPQSHEQEDGIREALAQDLEMMTDPNLGYVPSERLISAKIYRDRLLKSRAAINGIQWFNLGPKNQGGRSRTMLIDANDASGNTVFIGSVGGGLWKTTNIAQANPNWTPVNDFLGNIAITTLAQDPSSLNVMYMGTGEGYFNSDAIRGLGIWKSTNGGATWNQLASTNTSDFYYCKKLVVTSTGIVLVATNSGVYRSVDNGNSFTKVLGDGLGISGAVNDNSYDIEIAANGHIYASLEGSLHKSIDNGATWGSAMTLPISARRIELACAPNDANYVYALVELASQLEGILLSTNGGSTWTAKSEPVDSDPDIAATDFTRGQAWYDLSIAVDPNNKNVLYIGGIDVFKSTDGANNWTQVSHWYGGFGFPYVHADQHLVHYKPGSSSTIYFLNDGGIFQTNNGTSSTPSLDDKGNNYISSQFYGCAMHPTSGVYTFLGGTQDNGSHLFTNLTVQNTNQVTGGDGAYCNIDQNEPQFMFTQYVYNKYFRSTDGGATFSDVFFNSNGRFINPSDYDDINNRLYASYTAGSYFRWNDPQTGNSFDQVSVPIFTTFRISAVKVSPGVNNRVYFGNSNGIVVKVDNAHTNSPTITDISGTLPSGYINCIEVESGNENHIIVTYTNYGLNSIWETTDGGSNWTSIEGNLPDMPIRWAIFNPNNNDQLVIATELGVWSTDNINGNATIWGPSNSGLANVRVDQIQIRPSDKYMIASTHGRGLFASNSFAVSNPLPLNLVSFQATAQHQDVAIEWSASDETDLSKYVLERSLDNKIFSPIYTVEPKQETISTYPYLDNDHYLFASFNVVYYRLKMIHVDGKITYSDIRTVHIENNDIISVFPIPFRETININTSELIKRIIILNSFRQKVMIIEHPISKQVQLDRNLVDGVYTLMVETNKQVFSTQVIKSK